MTTEASSRLITVEEFFRLPDPPNGAKMELVCGRVVTYMPTSWGHGERLDNLVFSLGAFIRTHRLGSHASDVGFLLARNPDVVRAPDFAFVAREDQPEGGMPDEGWSEVVPTLAVEVISPRDTDADVQDKLGDYRAAGIPRVWLLRPRSQTVTVYWGDGRIRVFRAGEVLTSEEAGFSVDGFEAAVDELLSMQSNL